MKISFAHKSMICCFIVQIVIKINRVDNSTLHKCIIKRNLILIESITIT